MILYGNLATMNVVDVAMSHRLKNLISAAATHVTFQSGMATLGGDTQG